jgi:hypothetical protein
MQDHTPITASKHSYKPATKRDAATKQNLTAETWQRSGMLLSQPQQHEALLD